MIEKIISKWYYFRAMRRLKKNNYCLHCRYRTDFQVNGKSFGTNYNVGKCTEHDFTIPNTTKHHCKDFKPLEELLESEINYLKRVRAQKKKGIK